MPDGVIVISTVVGVLDVLLTINVYEPGPTGALGNTFPFHSADNATFALEAATVKRILTVPITSPASTV